ncbi:MAG TPA: diacylglycerol kinase family protein [Actinophytocola sp.]|uniref:diacylglycerol/lipid kinase family protein n=1 Tax=Actinophytocola sp. TaxID=1872138 RepID=UPI002DDD48E4|nr:diacylglycerol kinase family protein [Actinophytocola sp.]HEV2779904.1 diacylglycerol kinase family protein [Actinophytocola sp.]
MRRVVIIANPAAGTITPAQVGELRQLCRRRVGDVVVRWTAEPRHATRLAAAAAADGVDLVVSVGGDGTAREIVHGLAGHRVSMFIVPAGTSNSCYRSFWGTLPWPEALDGALSDPAARTRRLDLASLAETGDLVLSGASTGFPPQAVHEAAGRSGPDRYHDALADLATRFEPYPGRVCVDGTEVHKGPTMLANIGGSRYRGGRFEVLPHSVIDDGLLDVCVIGGEHDPAEMLTLTAAGEHVTRPGVVYARGRRVTVERTDGRPVWFEHDGELCPDPGPRFTLEVVPNAVPMLVGEATDLGRRIRAA